MNHEAMDAETVASLLGKKGVSVRQLRNYCDLGCPFEQRGRERVFRWHDVLDWYVAFKAGGVEMPTGSPQDEANPRQPRDQRSETFEQTVAAPPSSSSASSAGSPSPAVGCNDRVPDLG